MDGFEGFTGIRVGEEQLIDDLIFSLVFALLFIFSLVFHANYYLFLKMGRDVFYVKERLSLFEEIDGNETFFRSFMIFQSLLLCSITLFCTGRLLGYIPFYPDVGTNLFLIGAVFGILLLFYTFKQFLYKLLGCIFTTSNLYKIWRTGYIASVGMWGILMYIPVLCLVFVKVYLHIYVLLFILLYILWRFVIIHKTISIFNIKGVGFLYIILYLCAQEILPFVFLYEGIIYLYNLY
ncbi:MAG: DUF4271 domain-containing protein [Tannerellaceae bacterium]|jgi:hypothetical protein|nr:DUF4271 domain-containing protein [Tannerellaceae bacterium]